MASSVEIEGWFSILATGMAGLRLLKEFGIRTAELDYFTKNFGKTKIEISAFAPPPLRDQFEPTFNQVEDKVKRDIEKIKEPNVAYDVVDELLKNIRDLYSLLSDVHRTIVSGPPMA